MSFKRWLLIAAYFAFIFATPWQYSLGIWLLWCVLNAHLAEQEQHMRDVEAMMRVRRVAASRGKDIE